MNEPPENKQSLGERPPATLPDSEEKLEEVLSTLESILRHRHVVPESAEPSGPPADERDNLPLLKNVVVPGDPPAPLPLDGYPRPDPEVEHAVQDEPGPPDYEETLEPAPHHDDLVVRLVNELEIIIESSVDDALAAAKQELMVKVKTHLDIVLPEILDELERRRFDPDREDEGRD